MLQAAVHWAARRAGVSSRDAEAREKWIGYEGHCCGKARDDGLRVKETVRSVHCTPRSVQLDTLRSGKVKSEE